MPVAPKSPQFKQHPLSLFGGVSVLNAVSSPLVQNASSVGGDVLLIAPPSADDVDANGGSVQRLLSNSDIFQARLTNAAGTIVGDHIQLVYKAEGAREVVLMDVTGILPQGTLLNLQANVAFLMSPSDQGLFLRLVQAVPIPGSPLTASCVGELFDIRGPVRAAADVDAVQAIVPGGGNPALADTILENTSDTDSLVTNGFGTAPIATLFNFDSVDHTLELFITNGVDTVEISPSILVPAKTVTAFNLPALAPGWSAKMSLGEAVATLAPRAVLAPNRTNTDVARNDQAGAY